MERNRYLDLLPVLAISGVVYRHWLLVNTSPPSIALLAYAAAQAGLVLAAEPTAARLLARSGRWHRVQRLNGTVTTVYLWHFAPVLVIAAAFYPAGVMPQPAIGSAQWWVLRPAWLGLLTVVLVPMTMAIMRAERPMPSLSNSLETQE